ncbi:hypothetical protein Q3G72_014105 [Acer saccharum]|nr:hypothetical protein Q3G72_014105 [Acer saccharum]
MYVASLNIPTINPLHFSSQTPTGLFPNAGAVVSSPTRRTRSPPKTTTVVSPRAVAAVESISITSSNSLYEVLRVDPTASMTEIKTAYRSLAKVYHPDLSVASSDGRDFIEIHNAYETLSDPAARAVYDLSLVGNNNNRRRTTSFDFSGRGGFYPSRRWETDQCW